VPGAPLKFSHQATARFWIHQRQLPQEIQILAGKAYRLLKQNPRHPSLQFKKIGKVWSVRVGLHHRALATQIPGGFLWFWIGQHDEYDLKIK
jgi:hypothetical protein